MSHVPPQSGIAQTPLRGALVPTNGTFAIVGVHQGIVNLSAADEFGDYLISIISDPVHWTELAILVRPDDSWWARHRSVGDQVSLGKFECTPAPRPRTGLDAPEIPAAVVQETADTVLHQFRATGFVALLASEPPREDPFVRRAAELLREAPDRSVSSVSALIGLGIGFTPAGDDFVSGVILGQTMLEGALPSESDRAAVKARLRGTTAGGSSVLRVASGGFPPAYQMEIVDALAADRIPAAIGTAREHGHSSGLDALSGLLWRLTSPGGTLDSDIFDKRRRRV